MQPPRQHSRVNLAELKAQIAKKVGPDGSKQYFYYLNRFLSLKLNKSDFDNLCLKILGRENIPLHNHLIRSILINASTSKTPPPAKSAIHTGSKDSDNNHIPNGPHHANTAQQPSSFANGVDILLPISPKKARTGLRDRKSGDRKSKSTLGLNGKTNFTPQPPPNDFNAVPENSSVLRRCTGENRSLNSEKEKEPSSLPMSPIRAPLGVPFCYKGSSGGYKGSFFSDGVLWDSVSLRERMEHIALGKGLEGVSLDSADLLNRGLDSYMKRLISSCIELVGSRKGNEVSKSSSSVNKQYGYSKPVNGVRPGYKNLVQSSGKLPEVHEQINYCPISLRDFRVAMEMNPRNLGEDWPLLMEKICVKAFEE
ncbi:transcriptional adapter 1 [Striga asiatica]|uniref:Transcriptional adapter 1 n=1 Tax=Striga asiatica TaxID=4170 RepID=A0A5A7R9K0_STRAF|nr:transcriptional adapter 1 [Striga asiatica]